MRGFTVKFVGDQAIDWGAVTKSWASYLTAEIFHPDTGLLTSGVFSGNSGLSLRKRVDRRIFNFCRRRSIEAPGGHVWGRQAVAV